MSFSNSTQTKTLKERRAEERKRGESKRYDGKMYNPMGYLMIFTGLRFRFLPNPFTGLPRHQLCIG